MAQDMDELDRKEIENYLDVATAAALLGGSVLKQFIGKLQDVREKSLSGDLVTEADHISETHILQVLKQAFPLHTVLSEESGLHGAQDADFLWVVDPLDGTTNFAHSLPFVSISIALLYRKTPIVGVVYNPFLEECFTAKKGGGAFLNSIPITVSSVKDLRQSLLATGFAYDRDIVLDNNYLEFCYLTSITHGVRRLGSAALDLAYVASGRFEGFWERGLNVWDIAAGVLLVKEAGGKISSYEDTLLDLFSGRVLASNGIIHSKLSDELVRIRKRQQPISFEKTV